MQWVSLVALAVIIGAVAITYGILIRDNRRDLEGVSSPAIHVDGNQRVAYLSHSLSSFVLPEGKDLVIDNGTLFFNGVEYSDPADLVGPQGPPGLGTECEAPLATLFWGEEDDDDDHPLETLDFENLADNIWFPIEDSRFSTRVLTHMNETGNGTIIVTKNDYYRWGLSVDFTSSGMVMHSGVVYFALRINGADKPTKYHRKSAHGGAQLCVTMFFDLYLEAGDTLGIMCKIRGGSGSETLNISTVHMYVAGERGCGLELTGPPGLTGPQGPTGLQGPLGAQGPEGSTGPQGEQGVQGVKGDDGSQGPVGPSGDQGGGENGTTGGDGFHCWDLNQNGICDLGTENKTSPDGCTTADCQGDKGDVGIQGVAGPSGSQGKEGPIGPQGSAGDDATLIIEDDGTPVPGSPHGIVNFKGNIVTAVNAGASRVNVTIDDSGLVHRTGEETIAGVKKFSDRIVANDQGYSTSYPLSVQTNSEWTWIEMLNNGGAGKGVFFGLEGNTFRLHNYQGGSIKFYANAAASHSTLMFTMENTGVFRIHDLAGGVVLSNELGQLSYQATGTAFNQDYGTSTGTVADGGVVALCPPSSTDNAIARWDGTTGRILQNSDVIVSDKGDLSGIDSISLSGTIDGRDISVDAAHFTDTANPHAVSKGQVGLGNVENLKVNLVATAAPGATDDNSAGYAVGSRWIDVTVDREYVCLNASKVAAIWKETTVANVRGVYGAEFQYVKNDTEISTQSTSFVTILAFHTASLDGGVYAIEWSADWKHSQGPSHGHIKMVLDPSTVLSEHEYESNYDIFWTGFSGYDIRTLSAGTRIIKMQYLTTSAVKTTYARNARIKLYRVE